MCSASALYSNKSVGYIDLLTEIEEDILLFKIHSGSIKIGSNSIEYRPASFISAPTLKLLDPFEHIKDQVPLSENSTCLHNDNFSSTEAQLVFSQAKKRRPRWAISNNDTQLSEITCSGGTMELDTYDTQSNAVKKKKIIGSSKPFAFEPNDFPDNGESILGILPNLIPHRSGAIETAHKPPLDCSQVNDLLASPYSKGRYWSQLGIATTKLFTSKPFNRQKARCHVCGESHVPSKCPSRLCYNCYIPGHHCRSCNHPRGIAKHQCWRCENYGHISTDCPTLLETFKDKTDEHACCNCSGTGHLPWKCKVMNMDKLENYIKLNGVSNWLHTYYQKRIQDIIHSELLIFPGKNHSVSPEHHSSSASSSSSENECITIID